MARPGPPADEVIAAPRANSFVSCETCGSSEVNGGFRPDEGVVLCTEHMHSQADVDAVLTHELVHAYDQCRAKVDWKSGAHHACAEIRASSLSGECDLSQEINRGVFGLMAHHGKCVRRRAALSLALAGRAEPEATVDAVFDRCYADTAPFERHPDFAGLRPSESYKVT